jgi:hypothetical protein
VSGCQPVHCVIQSDIETIIQSDIVKDIVLRRAAS